MEKSKDTWTVLSSEYLHRAPWLTVRKDHVVLPNGNHIPSYYILEYPNWVNTIAITRDGQFVFIRTGDALEKRSKSMAAAVGGVGVLLLAVDVKGGIWQAEGVQQVIKHLAV